MEPIKDIELGGKTSADDLVKQFYEAGGFVAKKVGIGVNILEGMMKDKDCIKMLSFPAAIISTGTRGVIKDLVKSRMVDAIVTTCGTLDHDFARVWKDYYHGDFLMDDAELRKQKINRLGNILVPNESYGIILEEKMQKVLERVYAEKKEISSRELVWAMGEFLEAEEHKEGSIIYWAWKNKIPVFIPGITDGAVGSQLWMFSRKHPDFKVDVLKDEQELASLLFSAKIGALVIGGGISKHHTIWWSQFTGGMEYAVYITTAAEWDGSLSGAQTREAISWGKLKERAKHVTVEGDATVILPLMVAALKERLAENI